MARNFGLIPIVVTLTLILIGEFPICLGVYEHVWNSASLSNTYPYFDATQERNVTSFVGQVTHLHCTVRDIGDRRFTPILTLKLKSHKALVSRGLPKAKDLRPKPKLSHLRLWLRPLKV